LLEILIVSEQQTEQSGGETGALGAGSAVSNSSDAPIDTATASAQDARSVESPAIAPDQVAAKADEPKMDAAKAEMPKAEPFKIEGQAVDVVTSNAAKPEAPKDEVAKDEAPKNDGPKIEAVKAEPVATDPVKIGPVKAEPPRAPHELLIMSPREGSWKRSQGSFEKGSFESRSAEPPKPDKEAPTAGNGGRRFAAMAAMLLLAVIAGAAGGAFATMGMSHLTETASASAPNTTALESSVARIDSDITALKAGLEQTTKAGLTQFNKTSDRLERIEKAQAEPNAKLAKLSEAVDKLRAAPPATSAPAVVAAATPKDVTGTVTAPTGAQPLPLPQASPTAAAAGTMPKPEVGRLPTVDNWVLRDVSHGSALIEGRTGLYEVFAGDPVPGLGRVEAIRKQDGRWVVVTPKGLIVAR
jgi:hypothetical protein